MSRLIVLSRQGILVVSGVITFVNMKSGEVTIENDVLLPVSKRIERRRICFSINRNRISAMGLDSKVGSFILASVKSTPALAILADGGEDSTKEYKTEGYNMRFSGSFDFDALGKEKESHVFCASVQDREHLCVGGEDYVFLDVLWNRNWQKESRKLVIKTKYPEKVTKAKRGVFVTGPLLESAFGPVYKVKTMDLQ